MFARCLATVRGLLGLRGGRLEAGPEIAAGRESRVVVVEPDPSTVATMFALNLEAWRDEIDASLCGELEAGRPVLDHGPIVWRLRQLFHEAAR